MSDPQQGCPACGSSVGSGAAFCPQCGASLSTPDPFEELEGSLEKLKRRRDAGQTSENEYLKKVSELTTEDDRGRWRLIAGTGRWMWHDGTSWVARDPHAEETRASQATQPPAPPATTPPKRRRWLTCLLLTVLAGVVICAFGSLILWRTFGSDFDLPVGVSGRVVSSPTRTAPGMDALSADQREVVQEFGWPQSFTIADVDDSEGVTVRVEVWRYVEDGITYTFSDGRFRNWESLDPVGGTVVEAPYYPVQFTLGRSVEEVHDAIDPETWESLPGIGSLLEGVEVYAAAQLSLTFQDDRLVMVDALALAGDN